MVAPIEIAGNLVQVRNPCQLHRLGPGFRPIGDGNTDAARPNQQKYAGGGDNRAPAYLAPGPDLEAGRPVNGAISRPRPAPKPESHAGPFFPALRYLSGSMAIKGTPWQQIRGCYNEVHVARLLSDEGGKILDFYFLLCYCLADTLQVVKVLH